MKSSGIGGQAVLEGVMMKNKSRYSVAVRTPDGQIAVRTKDCRSIGDTYSFFRLPIIRGVVNFVEALILGVKVLNESAVLCEGEGKKPADSSKKDTIENVLIVVISVLLAVALFCLLPLFLSQFLSARLHSQTALAAVEGVLRILLFLGYVIGISFLGDIHRVFMYHGAEHKTINCVEKGLDLTVENVKKQSKYHRRCGTSFVLVVMFISVIFFLFIHSNNMGLMVLFRVLLIPVIAGVSYEFIRLAGRSDHPLVVILSKPGMWLQRLTTREPDEDMIEVAIASVEAVFDWRKYQRKRAEELRKQKKRKKNKQVVADSPDKKKNKQTADDSSDKKKNTSGKKKKSRAQQRRELEEREEKYRKEAEERERELREREEREAERKKKYKEIEARKAARMAATRSNAPAPKVELEDSDDLKSLDHFFDKKKGS